MDAVGSFAIPSLWITLWITHITPGQSMLGTPNNLYRTCITSTNPTIKLDIVYLT